MIQTLSEALGVSTEAMASVGAFDAFLSLDSQFHIDPALLKVSGTPELKNSYETFQSFFRDVFRLAQQADGNPVVTRQIKEMLKFPEVDIAGLGFAKKSNRGHAFGPTLASNLFLTSQLIIKAGVSDPVVFELIGLFEKNVGADLISDMTLAVILDDVLAFNSRIARELSLPTVTTRTAGRKVIVPCDRKTASPILVLPRDILSPLPVAESWSDLDTVTEYNEDLRKKLNRLVGISWKDATRKLHKSELRSLLLKDPSLFRDLIRRYTGKKPEPYDFDSDPLGEFMWASAGKRAAQDAPMSLVQPTGHEEVVSVVRQICAKFKQLVEQNALNEALYDDGGEPRNERFCQLLFYAVADSYCEANGVDLSREPNAGRGPVDFKVSAGFSSRVNVEMKLSTHNRLVSGFTDQLAAYNASERALHSFYLVIDVGSMGFKRQKLDALRADSVSKGQKVPELVFVDALPKLSASKL